MATFCRLIFFMFCSKEKNKNMCQNTVHKCSQDGEKIFHAQIIISDNNKAVCLSSLAQKGRSNFPAEDQFK